MIEKIANDVSNKLITPSNNYGDFIGLEAHIERLISMLHFGSGRARMIGICGPKGIGKSTIGRALYGRVMSQFHHRAFVQYARTKRSDYDMKLSWEEQFLSDILCQKDIKIEKLGAVEQRLKHKKVLIVLDDVDDIELLKTLVGQTKWFGSGSRIIVISSDRNLLNSHNINSLYEVGYPSNELALQMFCQFAFGENYPPRGFRKLAVEATELAGNLPDKLNTWGLSFRGKDKDDWEKMLANLQNGVDGKVEKENVSIIYDGLDGFNQNHIECEKCSNSQSQRNIDASHGRDSSSSQVKVEWIHLLHGVSILLHICSNGTKLFKQLSYNRKVPPAEAQQAKSWWSANREEVYEKYSICDIDSSTDGGNSFDEENKVLYAELDGKNKGLTYGQCSNPQPQRNMEESLQIDKRVHERIGTSYGFSFDFQSPKSVASVFQVEETKIECESGVYITLGILDNGTALLKHVEFSRRLPQHVKIWWSKNWRQVYKKHNICGIDKSTDGRVHFNVDQSLTLAQPNTKNTRN